jgi:hypothetical protein
MKLFFKLLYGLLALLVGGLLSWYVVTEVNTPHQADPAILRGDTLFVDYVRRNATWYEDFFNQETHFHGVQQHHILPMEKQSSCLTCHDIYPHQQDPKRRSFNNQHGHWMSCLTCHLKPELRVGGGYVWSNFGENSSLTEAGPYGLRRDGNGELTGAGNLISRIVPVLHKGVERSAIFAPYDDPRHEAFRKAVIAGRNPDREAFRREAEEKVGGPALGCRDCHAAGSPFPWAELGFSAQRIEELTQSSVVAMIEDYELFQFPVAD